ncbi:MAG: hypothetical protein CVV47_00355 [Spirochaetae bacterium HGW-Spirochaetae-3]|nr:MAG: hypothetical protein CVV47_00355 [Spirochaetae bacterium HGW-Spirochaetae-3]
MTERFIATVLIAIGILVPLYAEDGDFVLAFEGPRRYNNYIPSGADLSLTYNGLSLYPSGDTKLRLLAGGGYENGILLRDTITGDPWKADADGLAFDTPNFQWDLAFIQGLSRRADGDNLVSVFAEYRGRFDIHSNEGEQDAVFADMHGLFGTSVMGGASYDSRERSAHNAISGVYAEASAEWGPGFANARTDFWRVSGQLRGFLPVLDIPSDGGNLFNAYLAGFAGVDASGGTAVPMYVNESFGGSELRGSLGDCVRGYPAKSYDSSFKSVANVELRLLGPALGADSIVPVLYGFFDAGWYSGFAGSTNYASASGLLASVGGGAAIDVAGAVQLGAYAGMTLVDASLYYPKEAVFWSVMLFSHF